MSKIRVIIVEDDPIICEDIKQMLTNANYDTVAISYNKVDAINKIDALQPDLVLLDINLEGEFEGFDVANHINIKHRIPFIYVTSYSGKKIIDAAKTTTPMGYIVKPFRDKELFSTLEIALYNYARFMMPVVLKKDEINKRIKTPLTQKEFETLEGLYQGKTNQQLADVQFVSINTIKTHIKNIYEKMNTNTRLETITLLKELLK
ncbi:MAG: hypothetical protein Wins2KO_17660 [Winogradskyella sp.]|uniref:response regulator n=1 Tax=Winogradskyella sp. TaxID=1883156 RepID=UPI0025E5811E|nr:response regulator [Winogradskyella sp.]NRB59892.1 response regulator [Winogradskyella sp.]